MTGPTPSPADDPAALDRLPPLRRLARDGGRGVAWRVWPAAGATPPRGRVHLVHGLGEHLGRQRELAERLAAAGWEVVAHDHVGHGESDGARGVLPAHDTLLADLAAVVDAAASRDTDGGAPVRRVLVGHSMGGAVAARFVAEALASVPAAWSRPVDALVLSSPALALRLGPLDRLKLWLGRLAPDQAVANGLPAQALSSDPAVVVDYLGDPRVHDRITPRLAWWLRDAGAAVRASASRWRCPTLLMWSVDDRLVDPAGASTFAASAPPSTVQAKPWPGLMHELFHERQRLEVIAHMLDWLDTQGRTPSSRPAGAH